MTTTQNHPPVDSSDREIVISRVFDAPRELVWEAWTNPEQVVKWWGPRGFTTTIEEMNVRPGGVWKHVMHGPDGTDYPNKCIFTEVVKPERIVYTNGGGKKGGHGVQFVSTWIFDALEDGKSRLTVRMVFPTAADRDTVVKEYGAIEGGKQTLERLSEHLAATPHQKPFVISRTFDAPRDLVWKAFTDPEHLKQWWGPKGCTMRAAKMDLRPGGTYHYCMRTPDGHDMWGKFVYREIVAPERLIFVNSFSDENGGLTRHPMSPTWPLEMLSTFTFVEHEGKTTLTIQWLPINANEVERKTFDDGRGGMTQGWTGTLDQLAAYLAK
jgi:uncharacterized protein YndB with AHSA1/START domain